MHNTGPEGSNKANGASNGEKVAVLDVGVQYGKVIDEKIRELSVESDFLRLDTPALYIKEKGYKALIILGGSKSLYEEDAPKYDADIFKSGIPILGIEFSYLSFAGMKVLYFEP